jgi:hypothetical protein
MRNETVSQESPERAEIGRINHESKARKSPGKNREDVERHRLRKRREAFVLDFNALVVRLTEEGKQRLMDRLYEIPPVRLIRPRRGIRSRPAWSLQRRLG